MRLIEIVPYQDRWPHEFKEIKNRLQVGLQELALRIDHIGSTSVVGLGAKDVIDIQVTVTSLSPKEILADAFFRAGGYRMRDDITEDHRPPGDNQSEAQWQKRYVREPDGENERRVHIHVRAEGAANQRYALLFRDFLRENRAAMLNYEKLKQELARLHPHDIDAYLAVKEPACDLIMIAAEAWAKNTQWRVPSSESAFSNNE